MRAEHQTAYALGEQLLALAQQTQNPALLLVVHRALGSTLFFLGAAAALTHLAQGIVLYDPSSTAPLRSSKGRTLAWCAAAMPPGRCGILAILTRGWRGMTRR